MKIGLLTLPLHHNYGGLLQCYALMTILKKIGHQPFVIHRIHSDWERTWKVSLLLKVRYVGSCIKHKRIRHYITRKEEEAIVQHTNSFMHKYITPCSPDLYTEKALIKFIKNHDFDAFIVGSDQCWRPVYTPCITNYFFDFLEGYEKKIKRLSYAASFGVDHWELNRQQTVICSELAKKFDAISVRENSGLKLCKDHLGVSAVHVLDPTMLLDASDYIKLVENEGEVQSVGNLFYYILDDTPEKQQVISTIASKLSLIPFTSMPRYKLTPENVENHLKDCIYPGVTHWLRSFMDAKMVITDSFHGCVFSIIFNKPFWVIGNNERGFARFKSLLDIFGLQDRLITPNDISLLNLESEINWAKVNTARKRFQEVSIQFLIKHLS